MSRDFSLEALSTALPIAWNMNQVILSYGEELEKIAGMPSAVGDLFSTGPSVTGVLGKLRSRAAAKSVQPGATGGSQKVRALLDQIRSNNALQGVVRYEPTIAQPIAKASPSAKAPVQQAAQVAAGPGLAQRLGGMVGQAQKLPGQIAAGIQGAGVSFRAGLGGRAPGTQRVLESARGAVQQQQVARGALATPKSAPVSDPMTYQVPTPQAIQGPGRVRPQPLQQGQVFQQAGTPVVPNPRADIFSPPGQAAPGGYFQSGAAPQAQGQARNWWANRSGAERAALIGGLGAAGGMVVGSSLD